jgi:DNA-binding LacI/PurR family transcriptional regulator
VIAKLAEIVRTTVTQVIASAMPSTDSTNRSGRRRMFASANRSRHTNVFPEAVVIAGDRMVVGALLT